jgi:hypothetical protein
MKRVRKKPREGRMAKIASISINDRVRNKGSSKRTIGGAA